MKSVTGNILGTHQDAWNVSNQAQPRMGKETGFQYGERGQLRRTLQKVRAGLMDQKILAPSKHHSEEQIADRIRHVVAITGKGPIGKFVGRWWNAIDERGLGAHCVAPEWADWDTSAATHSVEDVKQAEQVFLRKEERRLRMNLVLIQSY